MKTIERQQVNVYKDVVTEHTCDVCGKDLLPKSWSYETLIWHRKRVEDREVYTLFDICDKCFEDKLVKFFELFGSSPRTEVY